MNLLESACSPALLDLVRKRKSKNLLLCAKCELGNDSIPINFGFCEFLWSVLTLCFLTSSYTMADKYRILVHIS